METHPDRIDPWARTLHERKPVRLCRSGHGRHFCSDYLGRPDQELNTTERHTAGTEENSKHSIVSDD